LFVFSSDVLSGRIKGILSGKASLADGEAFHHFFQPGKL
jgi:hypothetical protein